MIISDGNPGELFVIRGPMINSDSQKISDMAFLDNENGYDISKNCVLSYVFLALSDTSLRSVFYVHQA